MSGSESFEVLVRGSGSNVEEWRRAQKAPISELRVETLTDAQKKVAKRFGISPEDYARGVLALRYGRERHESEERALGQHVVEFLQELGEGYRLISVIRDTDRLRWMLQIQTPNQSVGVPVSYEIADDVFEFAVLSRMEQLRELVFEGVGRGDAVAGRTRR
jgi:hypothetical protein